MVDERLAATSLAQGGVVLRGQALDAGMSDDEIRDLLRSKAWHRVRRGAYVESSRWIAAGAGQRHVLRCHAVRARLGDEVVFSHVSAAAIHGLDLWGVPLSEVHVMRMSPSSPRHEGGIAHHRWPAQGIEPVPVGGFLVTPSAWTVLGVAEEWGVEAGVVTADSALRTRLDPELLFKTFVPLRDRPGARAAGRVVSFADGRSESVGESRSRLALAAAGAPSPQLQAVILDAYGEAGRVDFWYEEYRTAGEFDGLKKYKVSAGAGPDEAGRIVTAEKLREDRLRAAGIEIVRWTWADLEHPRLLVTRLNAAFDRGRRLMIPVRWLATAPPRHPRAEAA